MRKKITVDECVARPIRAVVFGDNDYARGVWGRLIQHLNDRGLIEVNCVMIRDKKADKYQRQFNRYNLSFKQGAKEILRDINCVSQVIDGFSDYNAVSDLADNNEITTILWAPKYKQDFKKDSLLHLLTMLLFRRFCQEKKGFNIISSVNEDQNGDTLREDIVEYASYRALGMDFVNWMNMECHFINTFVETRVGGESIGSTLTVNAEKYFLCVFDKKDGLLSLTDKVYINEELSSYYVLRRHIYEGALCCACAYSLLHDVATLDQFALREKLARHLTVSLFEEIIPVLDVNFETVQAYTVEMLQRFEDASVSVKWLDYAENLGEKFKESIIPLIKRYAEIHEKLPKHLVFSLFCTIKMYSVMNINDDFSKKLKESEDHYKELWGEDISPLKEEIEKYEAKFN